MPCPDELKKLYMAELERRRPEKNSLPLEPRKGRAAEQKDSFSLAEAEASNEALSAWYDFHQDANHRTFADFYSKIFYCRGLSDISIEQDTFLELIADREFLFLEYGESYAPRDYPPLSHLVKSPDAEEKNYPQDKRDAVLDQAFVLTNANYGDYLTWRRNLKKLKEAREQRIQQMNDLAELPERFTIPIDRSFTQSLPGIELYLSKLFKSYADCIKMEYNSGEPWNAAIYSVMAYFVDNSVSPDMWALCFFHLFSKNTKKLAEGTLSNYTFSKPKKPVNAEGEPRTSQGNTQAKTRINILLFDQILELFIKLLEFNFKNEFPNEDPEAVLEQYREDAKFIFYQFTRYDRYYHYDLSGFWNGYSPNIHFNYNENYRDGVDFFGNLLRFHINHCIPNHAQWLEPVLDPIKNDKNPPLTILTTALLAEASAGVQAKDRLSNRVHCVVYSDQGKSILEKYEHDYFDVSAKRQDLINWVREHNLHIPREQIFLYEESSTSPLIQYCGQYVLEYFLRDRMIQASREVLYRKAKTLFDDLCFGGFSYEAFSFK